MAFNVRFYSFAKRTNSTKTITSETPLTLSCVLKDNTDIINPTIVVNGGSNFNPKFYNYCWIEHFNRYYFINTWRYIVGSWECDCEVDVLATFKAFIGNAEKYVLRCARRYNKTIVDTLYPALAFQPNYYTDTVDFQFLRTITSGSFILGIANRDSFGFGAVSYYEMSSTSIKNLVQYMLQPANELWTQNITGITDSLWRSIYGAFDYIKSCKWFPLPISTLTDAVQLSFGNYLSDIYGNPIPNDITTWYSNYRTLHLPTTWTAFDARERVSPYAHIYIVFNPFGVIELNPQDFTDTNEIKLYLYADYISGDGLLKIYKVVGSTEYFLTQKSAKISVDVNLTQNSLDLSGILKGISGAAGSALAVATTEGKLAQITSAIAGTASLTSAVISGTPSLSGSVGQSFDDVISMDGIATLVYQNTYFAADDNNERGKPLCEIVTLSTLAAVENESSGYILCAEGDMQISGAMKQELDKISDFLTTGFFYE